MSFFSTTTLLWLGHTFNTSPWHSDKGTQGIRKSLLDNHLLWTIRVEKEMLWTSNENMTGHEFSTLFLYVLLKDMLTSLTLHASVVMLWCSCYRFESLTQNWVWWHHHFSVDLLCSSSCRYSSKCRQRNRGRLSERLYRLQSFTFQMHKKVQIYDNWRQTRGFPWLFKCPVMSVTLIAAKQTTSM